MNTAQSLVDKYHVPAPRYTSYPTVPYWDTAKFDTDDWKKLVKISFDETNEKDGLSLYIHLPYCENLCTYCGCNTRITKNHNVEVPYIAAILKEWAMYRGILGNRPIIREVHLGGGTPTFFSAANLNLLIEGVLSNSFIHPEAEFSFEAHPANTTFDHLTVLYDLGFRRLSLGIQDFDPAVQLIINRIQSFEQVKQITNKARAIGYTSINFDLIYGLPLQTLAGLANTIQNVSELMPERIAFYSYAHVPWVKPGQRLFTEHDLPGTDMKLQLHEIGRRLFRQLGYHEIGMDHFALPGDSLSVAEQGNRLHRNFMGYTHQYTKLMIGLGVSAVSDTWSAFAQNVKKIEDYFELLNAGELPIVKGHLLTEDDMIIRKHILNIMCTGQTCWSMHFDRCEALLNGLQRMETLANDGLVEINSGCLKVTQTGKRFLRNICMALDGRLWADKPSSQLFSMAG